MVHNIIAREQLTEWRHFENTIDGVESDYQVINDYYECLIECRDDQASCKRICRRLLA